MLNYSPELRKKIRMLHDAYKYCPEAQTHMPLSILQLLHQELWDTCGEIICRYTKGESIEEIIHKPSPFKKITSSGVLKEVASKYVDQTKRYKPIHAFTVLEMNEFIRTNCWGCIYAHRMRYDLNHLNILDDGGCACAHCPIEWGPEYADTKPSSCFTNKLSPYSILNDLFDIQELDGILGNIMMDLCHNIATLPILGENVPRLSTKLLKIHDRSRIYEVRMGRSEHIMSIVCTYPWFSSVDAFLDCGDRVQIYVTYLAIWREIRRLYEFAYVTHSLPPKNLYEAFRYAVVNLRIFDVVVDDPGAQMFEHVDNENHPDDPDDKFGWAFYKLFGITGRIGYILEITLKHTDHVAELSRESHNMRADHKKLRYFLKRLDRVVSEVFIPADENDDVPALMRREWIRNQWIKV